MLLIFVSKILLYRISFKPEYNISFMCQYNDYEHRIGKDKKIHQTSSIGKLEKSSNGLEKQHCHWSNAKHLWLNLKVFCILSSQHGCILNVLVDASTHQHQSNFICWTQSCNETVKQQIIPASRRLPVTNLLLTGRHCVRWGYDARGCVC